jgi:hypothetical protein
MTGAALALLLDNDPFRCLGDGLFDACARKRPALDIV